MPPVRFALLLASACLAAELEAAEPLHQRIDGLIAARAADKPASPRADDAEFLRRAYLDLAGRIPTAAQARAFIADKAVDKRAKLIDQLLNGPDYAQRMTEAFHVLLMERLGDHPEWAKWLRGSFEQNKPWDQMAREILRADPADATNRGASFFFAKRLENYGQNPVDYPALTRDVGRLFLGKDLRCAQCHDHLFIDDYKQEHFQGLFAFFRNTFLQDAKAPAVGEKPTTERVSFMSVFKKVPRETGPALPGGPEVPVPPQKKGEEYAEKPNPKAKSPGRLKFSPLTVLAEQLPRDGMFARNAANRLWFLLMGRGIVHPLDLHHAGNAPSHPELLDLLAKEFAAHGYDVKWFLREIALSQAYQRSSVLPEGVDSQPPELFLTAIEKRLSAEQLLNGVLEAVGERESLTAGRKPDSKTDPLTQLEARFVKAFANPAREPEEEFAPSLKAALFVLNDDAVLARTAPRPGNLTDRLTKMTDAGDLAEELYLSVLTRLPTADEKDSVAKYLGRHADKRPAAVGRLVWSLLASTEFCVNH